MPEDPITKYLATATNSTRYLGRYQELYPIGRPEANRDNFETLAHRQRAPPAAVAIAGPAVAGPATPSPQLVVVDKRHVHAQYHGQEQSDS